MHLISIEKFVGKNLTEQTLKYNWFTPKTVACVKVYPETSLKAANPFAVTVYILSTQFYETCI